MTESAGITQGKAQVWGNASRQKWAKPEVRQRIIEGQQRYWENYRKSPKAQRQRRRAARQAAARPGWHHRVSEGTKKGLSQPEVRQKISEASKRNWAANP